MRMPVGSEKSGASGGTAQIVTMSFVAARAVERGSNARAKPVETTRIADEARNRFMSSLSTGRDNGAQIARSGLILRAPNPDDISSAFAVTSWVSPRLVRPHHDREEEHDADADNHGENAARMACCSTNSPLAGRRSEHELDTRIMPALASYCESSVRTQRAASVSQNACRVSLPGIPDRRLSRVVMCADLCGFADVVVVDRQIWRVVRLVGTRRKPPAPVLLEAGS